MVKIEDLLKLYNERRDGMPRVNVVDYEGVFYRMCRRTYRGHRDRSFDVCWQEDGKKRWETVGRASEGMTARKAMEIRMERVRAARNKTPEVPDPTVDEVLDLWLEEMKRPRETRSSCGFHLRPAFGKLRMSELGAPAVEALILSMTASGRAAGTVRGCLSNLSAAVNHAVRMGRWEGVNPVRGARLPKPDNRGERWFAPEESRLLIGELRRRSPWWGDAAEFALLTGARLTEIFRLRAADLTEGAGEMMMTAKGGSRQSLRLSPEARAVLERRIREDPGPDGLVFGKRASGTFRRTVADLGFNAGVTDPRHRVWFHTFRHTFATWMVREGTHLVTVQRLMRHAKIEMTMRYAHHAPDMLTAGTAAVSRVYATVK
jgi:integrase